MSDDKKKEILLVDDETAVTEILSKRLTKRGFTCRTAENGKVALERLTASSCPIVVMDIKMPVMDGIEALEHILDRWPSTQVILLSGHADMQIAVQAMDRGAFGFMLKPVDFEELLFKIEDAQTQSNLESDR